MLTIFVPLFEWMRGPGQPDTDSLGSWNNLAMSDLAAGHPVKAIPLFQRALADCERVLGADHPDTKAARANLAALRGKPRAPRHT
jgi:hypothetical protein